MTIEHDENYLINLMEPKIKKSLLNTRVQEREDLEQEIKIKIIEFARKDSVEENLGFWDFKKKFE